MKIFIYIASLVVLASTAASEAQDAPFGFEWGQSIEKVESLTGTTRDDDLIWGKVHFIKAHKAPITPPETDFIVASVDPDYGLGRLTWYSEDITSDAYGSNGKKRYFEYKELLTNKYGKPTYDIEVTGKKLWKDLDEFYQCLDYDGCGAYFSSWETDDDLSLALSLEGLKRGEGYLKINYEGPNWDKVMSSVDEAANAVREGAF